MQVSPIDVSACLLMEERDMQVFRIDVSFCLNRGQEIESHAEVLYRCLCVSQQRAGNGVTCRSPL
jgi:hypothetical protein